MTIKGIFIYIWLSALMELTDCTTALANSIKQGVIILLKNSY